MKLKNCVREKNKDFYPIYLVLELKYLVLELKYLVLEPKYIVLELKILEIKS